MEFRWKGVGAGFLQWLPIVVSLIALLWSVYVPVIIEERSKAREAFLAGQRDTYRRAVELTGKISQEVLAKKDSDQDWQAYLALLRGEAAVFFDDLVS